jgi:GAF domain-containing protein/anti-sigma regulatory factor (Ser/Thr protein kinase)
MQRRSSSGKPVKGRRTNRPKAREAPTTHVSDADPQELLDRRTRELDEALEQQAATAEILKVIKTSPADVQPVFETIVRNAVSLCGGLFANVFRFDGELMYFVASHNVGPSYVDLIKSTYPRRPDRSQVAGRVVLAKSVVRLEDVLTDPDYDHRFPQAMSWRRLLGVPMLREGEPIGAVVVGWAEAGLVPKAQEVLLKTFADQAVIAIENTRLLNELRQRTDDLSESLEQQTATSEVLKVISSSPGELEPVFNAMLANATRICDAAFGNLFLREGPIFRAVAIHNKKSYDDLIRRNPVIDVRDNPGVPLDRVAKTKQVVHIHDLRADQSYIGKNKFFVALVEVVGARTFVSVPMLKEGELIGAINMYRQEVRPFTDKQIELVKNFAAQAVIAIENTRLLNELRERTDDLSESLEHQTATSEVLSVISNSVSDAQPVFEIIAKSAAHACNARSCHVFRFDGQLIHFAAIHGYEGEAIEASKSVYPIPPGRESAAARAILTGVVEQIPDIHADRDYQHGDMAKVMNFRSIVAVPMLKADRPVGAIAISRPQTGYFPERQIELLKTFADQAVIAIENARLLNELRQRTDDLSESLEQQTATSEVLKVISSSPGELAPVFESLLASAKHLCGAELGAIFLREGDAFRTMALHGATAEYTEARWRAPLIRPAADTGLGRVLETKQVVQIADIRAVAGYVDNPVQAPVVQLAGVRSKLTVPMLKEEYLIGVIEIDRLEVRPFTDKQIELVQNFAAQAVIAIENTRLLGELRESLQQQTATADVLKVISRSTFDLGTVLQTLVESAARLCDADRTNITRQKDGVFFRAEAYGFSAEYMDYVRNIPIQPDRGSGFGRALLERRAVHIPDVKADPEYTLVEGQKLGDYRTVLAVPMLREGVVIGVLSLTRSEVRPFSEKQIELATTFADQAAIAIENVRLFDSVEARTRELAKSLEDLRATQDRLVQTQKLASLGQLTAGIAHEIKNPLNFVNNFSGVSSELITELQEALADAGLNEKRRSEITELTDTLRGNLDKVVQHGKRADAIVKNMLLHSREGSGEHRVVDVNTLVEESLNLAYHGARAEKQGFNITMERSLDPDAGQADVFPQDITRVLLNLISNGFYAAIKRKAEAGGDGYEPTLVASTRSLGDRVEIRVRDNGTGIPPEVKEKMFNPFFTTKPAGEGTGLGLSICHDIIVKQHGGSIEVDTRPGEFTEIRVILPRVSAVLS